MQFDSNSDTVGNLKGETYWLTSAFSIAVLGFTLGVNGVSYLIESVVSRKQIMLFSSQRHFCNYLGCAIGSVWAMISVKIMDSTIMAVLPFIITAMFFLCVILVCLRNQLEPHWSHSMKQQEK